MAALPSCQHQWGPFALSNVSVRGSEITLEETVESNRINPATLHLGAPSALGFNLPLMNTDP